MVLIGILVAGSFAEYWAKRLGEHAFYMIEVLLISSIGVLVGSHLLYALTNLQYAAKITVVELFGGAVFYGGLLGGLSVGFYYVRRRGYNVALYSDIAAMFIPLFHFFGRVGCYLGGCCYGKEAAWGIPYSSPALSETVNRIPVQLIEAFANLFIFAVIHTIFLKAVHAAEDEEKEAEAQAEALAQAQTQALAAPADATPTKKKKKNPYRMQGHLLQLYLVLYAIVRFFDEFWRGDEIRGIWGPFSTSQWISLAILVWVVIWVIVDAVKAHRQRKAAGA